MITRSNPKVTDAAYLFLDEAMGPAVLEQVRDAGTAQGVEVQPIVEAELAAVGDEPSVQPLTPTRRPRSDGEAAGLPSLPSIGVAQQRVRCGDRVFHPIEASMRKDVPNARHTSTRHPSPTATTRRQLP